MVNILVHLFIKDEKNYKNPEIRRAYGVLCGCVGILLNIFLFALKLLAGTLSKSIAITADAINNLSDAGSSVITLLGFKMAGQKPDLDHPFGHGRIEYLSGLFVSIVILLMSYELIVSSIQKIIHPEKPNSSPLILIILFVSIAVKLYMAFYNHSIGKKIDSTAMFATATDSLSDTLATTVVLISTIFTMYTGINIDGYCGVLVGFFIFYAGLNAAKDTISPLLGQPPEKEFVEQIEKITLASEHVLGLHDLIVHDYGPGRIMISLHAEVPASGNILELHDEIDNLERKLKSELQCEAVIHMDPIMHDDEETIRLKNSVTKIIQKYDSKISIHDFRIVKGSTHTNLIFDVLLPMDYKVPDSEVADIISMKISDVFPDHFCVIQVDRSFNTN